MTWNAVLPAGAPTRHDSLLCTGMAGCAACRVKRIVAFGIVMGVVTSYTGKAPARSVAFARHQTNRCEADRERILFFGPRRTLRRVWHPVALSTHRDAFPRRKAP